MILVFGGTTEGVIVADILNSLHEFFFYSTKRNSNKIVCENMIYGDMNANDIVQFCVNKHIKLIINAAHPFAIGLHTNISVAAKKCSVTVIHYRRVFPNYKDNNVRLFSSYDDLINEVLINKFNSILALTGVNSINKLRPIWKNCRCYFRVLNNNLSINYALGCEINPKYIIPEDPVDDSLQIINLIRKTKAELVISKESGLSGQVYSKVVAAKRLNIPLWIIKHPKLPKYEFVVDSEKQFLQTFYQVRRRDLKIKNHLREGYSTGTCVTAAVKACFFALINKKFSKYSEVKLPGGDIAKFRVFDGEFANNFASCIVVKDAGDDPDITHGKEIGCALKVSSKLKIEFKQGEGVGMVTLDGLGIPVGQPAISNTPRRMISEMLIALIDEYSLNHGFIVSPFIPEGKALASLTFNSRVGVVSGLSILGTSGKVIPYSHEAYIDSIKKQFCVLQESLTNHAVLTSGQRSESIIKHCYSHLPKISFIHFGNYVGESLNIAVNKNISKITIALMYGKAVKLAQGHFNTHSKLNRFSPEFISSLARKLQYPKNIVNEITKLKIANGIFDIIKFNEKERLYYEIAKLCFVNCKKLLPDYIVLEFVLLTTDKNMIIINEKSSTK